MNYTKLFYWLVVADNAKAFFVAFIIIFTIISLIATIAFFAASAQSEAEYQKMSRKWMWWSYPFMVLFWALYVFTPNKKDALLIVAGGQIANFMTSDSTARQIPHEALTFVVTELKSMASEAKVDLGINDTKEKKIEEAKKLSTEEFIKKLNSDPEFAKLFQNN
jgi:hypothetical protein